MTPERLDLDAERHDPRGRATFETPRSKAVINVGAALARMGGDSDLLADVAQFFLEDAPQLMAQMRTALGDRQAVELAHAAHTLKGLASNFDAIHVQMRAAELESAGHRGQLDVAPLIDDLEREVSQVESALRREVLSARSV